MLMPPSEITVPSTSSRALDDTTGSESLTEGYGEPVQNSRTLGGGVDFFSSLGTEKKKKQQEEKPDPDKVSNDFIKISLVR